MKRIDRRVLLLVAAITFFSVTKSFCQATVSADSIKSMLIKDWERAKAYTGDYLKAMPSDKYSTKATDSVRSFAQQFLHIAEANRFFISTAGGEKMSMEGPGLEKSTTAQSADSVIFYVNSSYDYAINTIKNMQASTFMQNVTLNMGQPFTTTRLSWLLKGFEHQTHHRGQTTVYLRLAGVRPPEERLF